MCYKLSVTSNGLSGMLTASGVTDVLCISFPSQRHLFI